MGVTILDEPTNIVDLVAFAALDNLAAAPLTEPADQYAFCTRWGNVAAFAIIDRDDAALLAAALATWAENA